LELSSEFGLDNSKRFSEFIREVTNGRRKELHGDLADDDNLLPEGWKMTYSNGGRVFISPESVTFRGERAALQGLIQAGAGPAAVRRMKNFMTTIGWLGSGCLPHGWIYTRKFNLIKIAIVTNDGDVFENYESAREHLETSSKFSHDDLLRFDKFMAQNKQERNYVTHEWMHDDGLPNGWRWRLSDHAKIFLSADGQTIKGEKASLQKMIKGNDPKDEQVAKMKKYMTENGWKTSEHLPEGWIYSTKFKKSIVVFLSEDGEEFESYKAAQIYLESSGKYAQSEVKNFDKLRQLESKEQRRESVQPGPAEAHMPPGWLRLGGRVPFFIAPDGGQSMGKMKALQHMVDYGVAQGDIIQFLEMEFSEDGWRRDSSLPNNWFVSIQRYGHQKKVSFITDKFKLIMGELEINKMLNSENNLTEDEILGIMMFLEIQSAQARAVLWDWQSDASLPTDWRRRQSGRTKELFLSPDGQQFESRVRGLQHLRKEDFGEEQVEEMQKCVLEHEGWEVHSKLPAGWIFKDFQSRYPKFLTNHGNYLTSFEAVMKHLRSEFGPLSLHIGFFMRFQSEITKRRRESKHDWLESEDLPAGWKMRTTGNKRLFLSPALCQFQGPGAAARHMLQGAKYDKADIEKMQLLAKRKAKGA
jgi:hypothetical protein